MSSSDSFLEFWSRFPRKVAKADARKAWERLNPSPDLVQQILTALSWQVEQEQWTRDDGAYVPYPATWIRGERWEDEPPKRKAKAWTFDCAHEPHCRSTFECVSKRRAS